MDELSEAGSEKEKELDDDSSSSTPPTVIPHTRHLFEKENLLLPDPDLQESLPISLYPDSDQEVSLKTPATSLFNELEEATDELS